MIAPDIEQIEVALSRAAAVGETVSVYAGVIGHVVPVLLAGVQHHDLTGPQVQALRQAIATGQDWTATVCETLAQDLVPLVTAHHRQFLYRVDALRALRSDVARSGTAATPQHRQRAINLFEELKALVEDMEDRLRRGNRKVIKLIATAALDRAALEALSNGASGSALGPDDFLTRQIGFCKVPVALRPEVEARLAVTTASDVYALAVSASTSARVGADKTVAEMGQLPGIWGYALGLLRAQIEDLTAGPTRDIARIIDLAELDNASAAWSAMVTTIQERCPPRETLDGPGANVLRLAVPNRQALP
ncbi:hypothetical protein [Marivivens marinus]|uniref:hypothetical protein n=1 Tax=Marivivens marinus TaxID=3110173 RepID=UPI003B8473C8